MIRLHHCHQSRSMRSLWLLNELGIDFELIVHPFDKYLRSNEYLQLNPAGRVPSLELDGQAIWESGAITELLCERYPDAGLGRSPDDAERADWLVWVHFSETISQHTAALTQQHIALYDDSMRSPVVMKLESKRLEKCYQAIEYRLANRIYLLDGGFSAADISVGQAIYMAKHFAKLGHFSNLDEWFRLISERPAFKASLPPADADLLYNAKFYEPWDV